MSTPNLIQNSNFAGLCQASAGTYCITSSATLIAPWVVDSCSALPASLQASCNAGKGQLEQDNQIFPNPTSLTNIDLNPNAPSAVYQDVMIPGGFTGLSLSMQVGFNNLCGGSSGTFMLNVTNLVTNATLYSAVLTGKTGPFVTQSVNIPSTACGATRVEFISQAGTSCGPLTTGVTLSATGTPPANAACSAGFSVVNAPSNTIASVCGTALPPPFDPSLLLPQTDPKFSGYTNQDQNITAAFAFTNYGQTLNFTKFGDCLPISSSWSFPSGVCTLTNVFDSTQPCWTKIQSQFNGNIFMQATSPAGTSFAQNCPLQVSFTGAALQASTTGAIVTQTLNFVVTSETYDSATGDLVVTIAPSPSMKGKYTYVSGLTGPASNPAISGPLSQTQLTYNTNIKCISGTAQTFTYTGSADAGSFSISLTISKKCTFSYAISNTLVSASITDNGSTTLQVNDIWDLTLSSAALTAQGYYIKVTGVTIADGVNGIPVTIDPACWNKLIKTNTFGNEVFEFPANVMSHTISSYTSGMSFCSNGALQPFLLYNKSVIYQFAFTLSFNPTSAKRDGNSSDGVIKGVATATAAVDTTRSASSAGVSFGLNAAFALAALMAV
ncbi:hypothetical protein HDU98_010995 [Podochytrium sp. JEL0797]|nr:hypothetical protein HDU98_010995 [Podochytrium sp. JEL0797]